MLPRKQFSLLQSRLQKVENDLVKLLQFRQKHATKSLANEFEPKIKKEEHSLDMAIREAFLKFMATIMYNYKNFLKTVTRRPDIKALDRNLATYFDSEGFIRSKDTSCMPRQELEICVGTPCKPDTDRISRVCSPALFTVVVARQFAVCCCSGVFCILFQAIPFHRPKTPCRAADECP
jgi:hypothetical protein